jgi:hypothetical protein
MQSLLKTDGSKPVSEGLFDEQETAWVASQNPLYPLVQSVIWKRSSLPLAISIVAQSECDFILDEAHLFRNAAWDRRSFLPLRLVREAVLSSIHAKSHTLPTVCFSLPPNTMHKQPRTCLLYGSGAYLRARSSTFGC